MYNFTYGLLTPGLGYVMSCLGIFLGLRCTIRARSFRGLARARWFLLGGVSIGATGVWLVHFIAMLGFSVPGAIIYYDVPFTILSLLVAVAVVCAGLMIVGFGGREGPWWLLLAGLITGLGMALMHYLGMAALRLPDRVSYQPALFALSIVIAVVAATVALWGALRLQGIGATLAASMVVAASASGMHYVGMAAMRMSMAMSSAAMRASDVDGGATAESFLIPLILGIIVLSFVLSATIALSPSAEEIRYDAALMEHIRSRAEAERRRSPL